MENRYAAVASEKEDEKLLQILEERATYEPEAILAVIDEVERRNLAVPDLEQIKQEVLRAYTLQQHPSDTATTVPAATSFPEKLRNFGMLFVPQQQYVVTPVLINLNILIFIVLALSGVHVLSPEGQDLIAVGANFGPYTLTGEWWRLFSSMFLHIGVLHLLVNMYALASIGGVLESLVGKKQFALAYVLCGLAGSLGSLWWDQMRISAGASGAIFGMFGMFMTVVLLEREMSWQQKKGMVLNMLGVIAFNLVFGLQSGIDNAAHTGGLVMGIVFGAVLLLRSGRYITHRYSSAGNVLTVAVVLAAFTALYIQIPATHARYLTTMQRFEEKEQEALVVLKDMQAAGFGEGAARYTDQLEQGIAIWSTGIAELEALEELPDLPAQEVKEVAAMLHYARLRKKSYEMMRDDLQARQPWMNPKQQQLMQAISTSVEELNQLRGNKNGQEPAYTPTGGVQEATDGAELTISSGKQSPLFVVDGIVLEATGPETVEERVSRMRPEDIETINVLKDSMAVRLYGEKARHGVVLISTRQQ